MKIFLTKIELLLRRKLRIYKGTGQGWLTMFSIMSMSSRSKKTSRESKRRLIWDISRTRKTSKTWSKISTISFTRTLTERWKTGSRSTMTITAQNFRKNERTFNDKSKTTWDAKRKNTRDFRLRRQEREPSRCQPMLRTIKLWRHIMRWLIRRRWMTSDMGTRSKMSSKSSREKSSWCRMRIDNELLCWKRRC